MPAKIIDIHSHVISTDTQRYPITPLGGKRSTWSADRPVTFEHMIAAMDQAGVTKAALVHSSTTYGYDNSYVADCVAAQLQRFTGVFSVDVLAPDASEKIRYWHSKKLTGLRIYTGGRTFNEQTDRLTDSRSFPAWECCTELGIPVCIQMLRPESSPKLLVLVKRFPNTRILIEQMLRPPAEEGPPYAGSQYVFDLAQYPNVYLKLHTGNVRSSRKGKATPETFFPRFVKEFGASRFAWGSSYPSSVGTLPEMVTEAKQALSCLSQEDQDWIFYKTAEKLYPALIDQ